MLNKISSIYGQTQLRAAVVVFVKERDKGICAACGEAIEDYTKPNLRWKDVDGSATLDNLVIIHHGCAFAIKRHAESIAKPIHDHSTRSTSLSQDSSSGKQRVMRCSVHVEKKSEFYMALTCKHSLCAACEQRRVINGSCPACLPARASEDTQSSNETNVS